MGEMTGTVKLLINVKVGFVVVSFEYIELYICLFYGRGRFNNVLRNWTCNAEYADKNAYMY